MTITISMAGMYNPDDLYTELKKHLDFPAYFGNNLDALHDVLMEQKEVTEICFCDTAEAEVMMSKYMKNLRRMCKAAQTENPKLTFVFE